MKRVCWGLGSTLLLSSVALLSPGVVGAAGVSQAREVPPPPGDRGELLYELPGGASTSAVVPGRHAAPPVPTPAPVPLATTSRPGASVPPRALQKSVALPAASPDARPRRDRGVNDAQATSPKTGSPQAAATKPSVALTPARRLRQSETTALASRGSRREADEPVRPSSMSKTPPKMPAKASTQKLDKATGKAIAKTDTQLGVTRPRPSSAVRREGLGRTQAKQKVTAEPGAPKSLRQAGQVAPTSATRASRVSEAPSRKVMGLKPKAGSRASQSAARSADTPRRATRSASPTASNKSPRERRVSRETPARSVSKAAMKSGAKTAVKPTATQRAAKPGTKPSPRKAVRPSPR